MNQKKRIFPQTGLFSAQSTRKSSQSNAGEVLETLMLPPEKNPEKRGG
jgi:hypothetical protein